MKTEKLLKNNFSHSQEEESIENSQNSRKKKKRCSGQLIQDYSLEQLLKDVTPQNIHKEIFM